mgnify:CR=1 FL=1
MHVYGDKVSFYSYFEDDLSGVIIENKHIAKSQLSLFQMAYEYGKLLQEKREV